MAVHMAQRYPSCQEARHRYHRPHARVLAAWTSAMVLARRLSLCCRWAASTARMDCSDRWEPWTQFCSCIRRSSATVSSALGAVLFLHWGCANDAGECHPTHLSHQILLLPVCLQASASLSEASALAPWMVRVASSGLRAVGFAEAEEDGVGVHGESSMQPAGPAGMSAASVMLVVLAMLVVS